MKTVLTAVLMFLSGVASAANNFSTGGTAGNITNASPSSFSGYLANEAGLSHNQTYLLDMSQFQGSRLSFEVLAASTSWSSLVLQDGEQSTGQITVSNYAFIGTSSGAVTINGVTVQANRDYQAKTSNAATTNLLTQALAALNQGISYSSASLGSNGIIYATSTLNGAAYNYTWSSTSNTANGALYLNGQSALTGGVTPDFTLGSQFFSSTTANGWTAGTRILYNAAQTPAIGGLTGGTTYYAAPTGSPYIFRLALYSTSASAGNPSSDFVTITSTSTGLTQNNYNLTPTIFAGSPAYVWQASNDGTFFTTAPSTATSVNSVTIPVPTGAGVTTLAPYDLLFDFGYANFRYYRLNVTAPTQGGLFLQATPYIKQDGIGPF